MIELRYRLDKGEMYLGRAEETLKKMAGARLIFMDPPFNQGEAYDTWDDDMDDHLYERFLETCIKRAGASIAGDGSLWVHVPDRWAANAVCYARDRLGMRLENWVIWHYRFAVWQPNRFLKSKCHGLWFSWGDPVINREAGLVPSDRASIYNDGRAATSSDSGLRMDLDVWGFDRYWGRVQGNNQERRSLHPNQLPEKYLKRIIGVLTNEGDLVGDPFCGSGTTAVVAGALNRRFITGDVSEKYLNSACARLEKGAVRV